MYAATLLVLLCVGSAYADHFTCNWDLEVTPYELGWQRWCIATRTWSLGGRAVYHCQNQSPERHDGLKVADWNVLGKNVLEFGTPCGGGGYALDGAPTTTAHTCAGKNWAVCVGRSEYPNIYHASCYGLKATDDCQWPFQLDKSPGLVDIWFDTQAYALSLDAESRFHHDEDTT
ncbi:unnamed protein product [Parajaminaea phylloscopi]